MVSFYTTDEWLYWVSNTEQQPFQNPCCKRCKLISSYQQAFWMAPWTQVASNSVPCLVVSACPRNLHRCSQQQSLNMLKDWVVWGIFEEEYQSLVSQTSSMILANLSEGLQDLINSNLLYPELTGEQYSGQSQDTGLPAFDNQVIFFFYGSWAFAVLLSVFSLSVS